MRFTLSIDTLDQGSVALDTGLSVGYDLATPVGLLSFFPLLFFHTDPRSYMHFTLSIDT